MITAVLPALWGASAANRLPMSVIIAAVPPSGSPWAPLTVPTREGNRPEVAHGAQYAALAWITGSVGLGAKCLEPRTSACYAGMVFGLGESRHGGRFLPAHHRELGGRVAQ